MGSEVAEGNIPTDTVGSNIESREMSVETVDSLTFYPLLCRFLTKLVTGGERGGGAREQHLGGGTSTRGHQSGV